jgi:hypothetical protein
VPARIIDATNPGSSMCGTAAVKVISEGGASIEGPYRQCSLQAVIHSTRLPVTVKTGWDGMT